MTLIEIIIVIALIAGVTAVAMPQMFQTTESEVQAKLGQLAGDFRSAFDIAVLTGKPYRMGFRPLTGEYWLEAASSDRPFKLGDARMDKDLTSEEEDRLRKEEESRFDEEYDQLAGETFRDPEDDKEIKPTSPVLKAKSKLMPPRWQQVDSMEWGNRTLGPNLMITEMQAEHHQSKQEAAALGPEGVCYIYVFPTGYTEKSYLKIAYTLDEGVPDETKSPYLIVNDPYTGTIDISSDDAEIDVHDDRRAQ